MTEFLFEINFGTQILMPLFLTGILALGSSFSFYLYKTLKEKIFLKLSLFQIVSLLYVIFEVLIVYYCYQSSQDIAIQFSRLKGLSAAAFLGIIPVLIPNLLQDKYPNISKYLFYAGSALVFIIFIGAFIYPDSFISVTEYCKNSKIIEASSGRGKAGILYYIRDIALAIMFIIVLVYLFINRKKFKYQVLAKFLIIGILLTIIFSCLDIIMPYLKQNNQLMSFLVKFSYSSLGLTLFSVLSIIGELRLFIEKLRNNQKNLEDEVKARTNDLEKQIKEKEETEKKLRDEMEKAVTMAEKAKEASRIKSEFLSNISHEIRTPMTAFIELSQDLLNSDLTAQQKEEVKTINKSGRSLKRVVSNILDFSRLRAGKLSKKEDNFNLKELILNTKEEFIDEINKKSLGFEIEYDAPEVVRGSKNRIGQIIKNLIDNAVKFTKKGKIKVEVTCQENTDENCVYLITIKDTGIGIPQEIRNAIFKPFIQADGSSTREFGGTGIGLTLTKQLTEFLGGKLEYESTVDEGSIFKVYLPVKSVEINKDKK